MIEACSGQETRRNAQGMARPFQALQRSILEKPHIKVEITTTPNHSRKTLCLIAPGKDLARISYMTLASYSVL
ncbi:MAG: hypothetical protein P8179_07095 [Candidatus Thiodiazotropha sp.]